MRNVFVVIVFACIGLSYEFIVPLGILKVVDETSTILKNDKNISKGTPDSKDVKLILLARNDLESGRNRIEDHELFDQSNGKQNNITERSFIFINQKFRTPVFGSLYGPLYSPSGFLVDTTSLMGQKRTFKHYISRNDSLPSNLQGKASSKQTMFMPAIPVKKHEYQYIQKHQDVHPSIAEKTYITHNISHTTGKKNITNVTHYVEPPSILQSTNQVTQKKVVEPIWPNFHKYQPYPPKKPKQYIQFESKQMSPINPIIYEPDNNGYPSPFGQRSNKPEEIERLSNYNNIEKYYPIKFVEPRARVQNPDKMLIKEILNDDEEINKILDGYVADPFNGSDSNERLNVTFECEYNDCYSESKPINENKHSVKNNCKCESHRQNATLLANSVSLEKTNNTISIQENTTETNSIELNDYGNSISDETIIEKYLKRLL